MFGLFRKKNNKCPIDDDQRLWMENAFLWLAGQFGDDMRLSRKTVIPTPQHFPIKYDGSRKSLIDTAEIVARQMDIDMAQVNLQVYDENLRAFSGGMGHTIYTEVDKESDVKLSSGLYFGKNETGQYDIFIEQTNMSDPVAMVATLAHEFAHIKLLGENRVGFNDEMLTDLTALVFGLGIFNANASYNFSQSSGGWMSNSIGYLKQQDWGYGLALYAYYREERSPAWLKYLSKNVQGDFRRSEAFIYENEDRVFREEYKG